MECLALNGIQCEEVVINAPFGTDAFLVHNWEVRPSPLPNRGDLPNQYYAGSWRRIDFPPLSSPAATNFSQTDAAGASLNRRLEIDMRKRPGVPAQGQGSAPLFFNNHWIVRHGGQLYDTSYGGVHPDDLTAYAKASLGGWRVASWTEAGSASPQLGLPSADAWFTEHISRHTLRPTPNGFHN